MLSFEFAEEIAQRPPHGSGFLRAAARDHRRAERGGEGCGDVFGDVDERPDQPEVLFARVGDRRKSAQAAREHCISQQITPIVGRVTERDDIRAEAAGDLVNGAPAVAATEIASVIGLLFEQPERRAVVMVGPIDAAAFFRYSPIPARSAIKHFPCSTVNAQTENSIGARSESSFKASRRVSESFPPDRATATRSPSRIMRKR